MVVANPCVPSPKWVEKIYIWLTGNSSAPLTFSDGECISILMVAQQESC